MQRDLIEKWIKNRKPGEAFTIKDLPHGISRDMGDKMLSLMVKDGRIRRAARGIYYIPQWSQLLKKEVGVDVGKIAYAIARKFDWEIRPSDEYAVNLMGLSTQIPAHYVYVTTGPSKKYQIDGSTLTFVHRCNREMMLACPDARDVVRALKGFGRYYATPEIVAQMSKRYTDRQWEEICKASKSVSNWIRELLDGELMARRARCCSSLPNMRSRSCGRTIRPCGR